MRRLRRFSTLVPLVIIALVGFLVALSPAVPALALALALAQDGTPSAAGDDGGFGLEGVSFEPLALASGMTLPGQADLVLVRIGLEPGAVLPSDPDDASLAMVLIESGEITLALDGPVTITRAGAFAPALATAEAGGTFVAPEETTGAGETVTVGAGDVVFFPPNIGGEIRNDGADPVVGLAFIVEPPSSGGALPAEGTPATGTPTS